MEAITKDGKNITVQYVGKNHKGKKLYYGDKNIYTEKMLSFPNVRERFSVEISNENDSKENFQKKLRITIKNETYSFPCVSINELEIIKNEIDNYLNSVNE